jgi:superfamily II DNA/RNA helicase
MKGADRDAVHEGFLAGEVKVVVATSAFGMGIDNPDVRFVVHAASPARSTPTTRRSAGPVATETRPRWCCATTRTT